MPSTPGLCRVCVLVNVYWPETCIAFTSVSTDVSGRQSIILTETDPANLQRPHHVRVYTPRHTISLHTTSPSSQSLHGNITTDRSASRR